MPDLRSDNPQGALQLAQERKARIEQTIFDNPGIQLDTTEVDQFISLLETPEGQLRAAQLAEQVVGAAQQQGLLGTVVQDSAGTREFNNLLRVAQDPNSTELEKNSALFELGQRAKVSDSAQERIAQDPTLTTQVAQSQAEITGAKEGQKLAAQLRFKPEITKAVKSAESAAKERGEVLTSLARSKAALPGLTNEIGRASCRERV